MHRLALDGSVGVQGRRINQIIDAFQLSAETSLHSVLNEIGTDLDDHENVLQRFVWMLLCGMGLMEIDNAEFAEIKARLGVIDLYERWLLATLDMCARQGRLKLCEGRYAVAPDTRLNTDAVVREWETGLEEWSCNPNMSALVKLETEALRALPAILRGEMPATDVLFPEGSMVLVEGLYKNNLVADYFNEGVAKLVEEFVKARLAQDGEARIRILEIGAGTGGTSAGVFARLEPYQSHIAEYCYTDLSPAFLRYAQQNYGPCAPYLVTRILDIERPISVQSLESGSYDLVIASNVLHATRNIRRCLHNAKAALCRQGLLVLNEGIEWALKLHITFGLLEGWWLYEDAALRIPGSSLLTPEGWSRVLEEEGFGEVFLPFSAARDLGQQLIVAENDGAVRQHLQPSGQGRHAAVRQVSATTTGVSPSCSARDDLAAKTQFYLKSVLSAVLKLSMGEIATDEPLANFCPDPLQVITTLEKSFGSLPKTLFFEYPSMRDLCGYFLASHRDRLLKLLGGEEAASIPDRPAEIAIIGLSGCYPQASDIREFWVNLREGRECIREIPPGRADYSVHVDPGNMVHGRWGGFIDGVDEFDPRFFGISQREAENMDPRERLFLQQAHACIEDAGYVAQEICPAQRVGVFVGVMNGRDPTGARSCSIANRVSNCFAFQGPSLAIDSACSSSLTALHLAVESLRSGASECAIAGGVNLLVSPRYYPACSSTRMTSEGKTCPGVGAATPGQVDGEGVGAVLLKSLAHAMADGDHIYGVIKGTVLNHDGQADGDAVADPSAQSAVIERALRQVGTDPWTVSCLEVHGMGTSLEDPLEITGLNRAFRYLTEDRQIRAIGSVKKNIGQCEGAAGIAGVTKVLLQMQHGQLAPLPHTETIKPRIAFEDTPFVVSQSLEVWQRPVLATAQGEMTCPRTAGVSSFAAGGANAHVVIEEYVAPGREAINVSPVLVLLSAQNEARLRESAQRLMTAIETYPLDDTDLADMAFTLQVGREAMEVRLGFAAESMADVRRKLAAYLAGERAIEDFHLGDVKLTRETVDIFNADEELQEAIEKWLQRDKYVKLLELWVKGLSFDWLRFYKAVRPHRISLPTYPFARKHHPVTDADDKAVSASIQDAASAGVSRLHPLLHRNTSNRWGYKFSSSFTGSEFFLTDHVVDGWRILPEAAYLEMARVAVMQFLEKDTVEALCLENLMWWRPLAVAETALEVGIGLRAQGDGAIDYEITGGVAGNDGTSVIHGQGRALLEHQGERPMLDLAALQANCNEREVAGKELYDLFHHSGLDYGPAHRGLERLSIGHDAGGQTEVLARLALPESVSGTVADYGLHPSMLDAALQAVAGVDLEGAGAGKHSALHAVNEVWIWSDSPPRGWAWVRCSTDSSSDDGMERFDIDLCDETGLVCVRMKGVAMHTLEGEAVMEAALLKPVWRMQAATPEPAPHYGSRRVVLCDPLQPHGAKIEAALPGLCCLCLDNNHAGMATRYEAAVIQTIEMLRQIVRESPREPVLIQIVVVSDDENGLFDGLSGALRTAQLENPMILGQVISLETGVTTKDLMAKLAQSARAPQEQAIRYRSGERLVQTWEEMDTKDAQPPWRDGGVYLITGGAGKQGLIFAREIAQRVEKPVLVLVGRSALDEAQQASLRTLDMLGAWVDYRRLDVTDASALCALVAELVEVYGGLNGVVHTAGVIRDSLLMNKTAEEVHAVLAPKVAGTIAIDEATRDLALEFLILFGSTSGVLGNLGQADYAAGNAFMDTFALKRNEQVARGERQGRSLSVDWPRWRDGGMQENEVAPLAYGAGIQALNHAWASGLDRVLVLSQELKLPRTQLPASGPSLSYRHSSAFNIVYESAETSPYKPGCVTAHQG